MGFTIPELDLSYLAGLFDGEGYFGVVIERNGSTFRFIIRPMFEFALQKEDSEYIIPKIVEFLPDVRMYVAPTGNKMTTRILIRRSKDLALFLSKIKPFVRLPSTKKKIELIEMIKAKKKFSKRLSPQEMKEVLLLVKELRKLSKKSKMGKSKAIKYDVDELLRNLPP